MNLIKLKKPEADLYRNHNLYLQVGAITTLLLFIALFKVDIRVEREALFVPIAQEIVEVEEIIHTEQEQRPPPPPRPSAPVEVPNDEIVVDEILDLDTELRFDDPINMPPPAPPTATKEVEEEPEVFVVVERMPELIGGLESLQKNIVYPEIARLAGIEGRVMVSFVIDEKGNVLNPVVVRGIGGGCDEAAVNAVKKAKFVPGMQRGMPVRVRFTLPITFRLNQATQNTSS
jgi:protein TonB